MTGARRILAGALALAALAALPVPARAQGSGAGGDSATRAALVSERQHVRADLEHANADITALKHRDRSLRDDYRLRARLADAEALARQLSALDARLGGRPAAATAADLEPRVAPQASPGDGPAEMDAKADILADQARRLAARGDVLLERATDLKARQTLRRRVGQMERDPFSPLEGSKRRAMTAGVAGIQASVSPKSPGGVTTTSGPPPANAAVGPGTGQATDTSPATSSIGPASTGHPGVESSTPSLGTTTPTSTSTSTSTLGSGSALTTPKAPPTPAGTVGASDGLSLAVQLRDLLDPTTLAEIQRLEATGGATSGLDALERAGAALKARAAILDQQAAALRAAGHAR